MKTLISSFVFVALVAGCESKKAPVVDGGTDAAKVEAAAAPVAAPAADAAPAPVAPAAEAPKAPSEVKK